MPIPSSPEPPRLRMRLPFVAFPAALCLMAPIAAQDKVDFQRQILPILERNCVECHAAAHTSSDGRLVKPKGGVMFDSKDGLLNGKKGKVVVARKPADSLLYLSISLPADDEDRMPPQKKGDPLPEAQQQLIKKWIEQGADFGPWKGKGDDDKRPDPKAGDGGGDKNKQPATGDRSKPQPKATLAAIRTSLQKGLNPVPAATLAAFAEGPFQVASIGDDSPLLRVSCHGHTDKVDDRAVASLSTIADHITELQLGRTSVGDAACSVLAQMSRLTALDLRQTQVGNQGAAALSACKQLRSLNLFGTRVGDYALAALAELPNLEAVYLWQTEVSAQAAVRLREALPGLRLVMTADLPEPMTEGTGQRRNRR